jgi:uncharacterized membrane protein YbaN (DUF454 family)
MGGRRSDRARLSRWKRPHRAFWRSLVFGLGCCFLVVGIAGVFLPLVPGTLFLILSAACFARSSPRFEAWLLDHPRLGPPVRKWRETGAIPRPVKIFAILSLALSWLILLATETPDGARIASLVLFAAVAVFIATRPHA